MANFVMDLNRWLPNRKERLLWIDHWDVGTCGALENALVAAAWRGLGEKRTLSQAPGILFDAQNWAEEDQQAIPPPMQEACGMMIAIISIIMISQSDGWLISAGCADRIEFWEGNLFFHSTDADRLMSADRVISSYGCVHWSE